MLEGAIDAWPALRRWTPDFWIERHGYHRASADDWEGPLGDLVRAALRSTAAAPAPYFRSVLLSEEFPELTRDVLPYPEVCAPNWYRTRWFAPRWNPLAIAGSPTSGDYELFIGGAGRAFPYTHYDGPGTHTFIHQIQGRKRLLLFPPEHAAWLYPLPGHLFSISAIPDVDDVDPAAFPLFANATPFEAEIGPGDTIFIPSGWWHAARMLSFSVSVALDVLNETNREDVLAYVKKKTSFVSPPRRVIARTHARLTLAWLRRWGERNQIPYDRLRRT